MNHPKPKAAGEARTGVRPLGSVLKTFALLDLLGAATRPLRLAELAQASGASRATTYQKLRTLVEAGWVEQDEDSAWRLTLHAARIGEAVLKQAGLGERSSGVLQELVLEVGETASLAMLQGVQAQLVQRAEAEVVVRVERRVGTLLSLDQSASGRVLTAFASPEQLALLARKGAVFAPAAVLRDVKKKGYAISTGRDVAGVQSAAVPVFGADGGCIAALSIVTPVERFNGEKYVRPLQRAAEKLTALLARGPTAP